LGRQAGRGGHNSDEALAANRFLSSHDRPDRPQWCRHGGVFIGAGDIGSRATAIGKEDPMYARLVSISGADAEKRERAIQTIRETVIPALRHYDGFAGYIALYDAQNRRAKAVLLWESEETAEAAEPELGVRRAQIMSELGFTVESADLYEAPVVELETVRV